jgi:hypothetical protein
MKVLRVFAAVAVLALGAAAAHADGNLFSTLDTRDLNSKALGLDASFRALADNPTTASLKLVRVNDAAVSEQASTLTLDLDGFEMRVHRVDAYRAKSGSLVWAGIIEDLSSSPVPFAPDAFAFDPVNTVMMVKNGNRITANIHFDGEWYKVRPLRRGDHAVVKVNLAAMPPDHPESYATLPVYRMQAPRHEAQAKVNTVIRVLVNYTASAAAAAGDINGLIDLAVAETNQGYANSGVQIDAVLAAKALTAYTESGSFDTDLARYRSPSDGFMDEIHAARDANAADVGVLIINNTQYCGLASGIGSTAATAFVAVYWDCATGYYSFAHEIGHLQSARHDPANDPTTTPYAWGHGYQYTKRPKWRTIMAYDCTGGCPRLQYWSNPNVLYNNQPMGTATKNHNARVLNDTRATVAGFR